MNYATSAIESLERELARLQEENARLRARMARARMAVEHVIEAADGTPCAAMLKVAIAALKAGE